MKNVKLYLRTIKNIIDTHYGKEIVFYDGDYDEWYSREHCRNITPKELTDWVLKLTKSKNDKMEDD